MTPLTLRRGGLSFSALVEGEGPTILCLHGFPDHARSFRFQLPAFARAGFRGIAATMRGYEPSSQPRDGDYRIVRMAEDVAAWIEYLDLDRVHLVGHDWGAIVGYYVAAMWPERLRSLTTLAIAHPRRLAREIVMRLPSQLAKSWYIFFFQSSMAESALPLEDYSFIDNLWRDWSPGYDGAWDVAKVKESIGDPEHIAAGILYLASDRAGYVTGHALVIDGGYTAQ